MTPEEEIRIRYGHSVGNGLFFKRLPDGAVQITQYLGILVEGEEITIFQRTLPPHGWVDVVLGVSVHPREAESGGENYLYVKDVHGGSW